MEVWFFYFFLSNALHPQCEHKVSCSLEDGGHCTWQPEKGPAPVNIREGRKVADTQGACRDGETQEAEEIRAKEITPAGGTGKRRPGRCAGEGMGGR